MNTASLESMSLPSDQDADGITKIVIAIHGIGQQYRSETIRSVAMRFGDSCKPSIPVLPLGYFNLAEGSEVRWSQLETEDPSLSKIGFAELYWADIPHDLVRSKDTLEETKAWARTVVSRAEAIYDAKVRTALQDDAKLQASHFKQGIEAVDTLTEGIGVIERICLLAHKAGAPKFEVANLLRDFVGDVQTVTEFPQYRAKILFRFHSALNAIVENFQTRYRRSPEIYLVAHSEGTVISLLALLQALSSRSIVVQGEKDPVNGAAWVQHVKGFMTIGSPIDKHIALWPGLWKDFSFTTTKASTGLTICSTAPGAKPVTLPQQIQWRNYFDYGDPVGFRLDEAQRALASMGCDAFEFDTMRHDFGYSRYWLPGKAHIDYWNDSELFRHFIDSVVQPKGEVEPPPPTSRKLCDVFAKAIPYAISFGLHVVAVLLLLNALSIVSVTDPSGFWGTARATLVLATLLGAVTVATRIPRLALIEFRWALLSVACFLFAAMVVVLFLPTDIAVGIGKVYTDVAGHIPSDLSIAGKLVLCAAALCISILAWVPRLSILGRGRRFLIGAGVVFSASLVIVGRGGIENVTWAEAVASLPFIFLWWLGIILFDLAFVWHRYIRQAVCVRTLRAWQLQQDGKADPLFGIGTDPKQKEINKAHKEKRGTTKERAAELGPAAM